MDPRTISMPCTTSAVLVVRSLLENLRHCNSKRLSDHCKWHKSSCRQIHNEKLRPCLCSKCFMQSVLDAVFVILICVCYMQSHVVNVLSLSHASQHNKQRHHSCLSSLQSKIRHKVIKCLLLLTRERESNAGCRSEHCNHSELRTLNFDARQRGFFQYCNVQFIQKHRTVTSTQYTIKHVKQHGRAAAGHGQCPLPFHSSHSAGHASHTAVALFAGPCQGCVLAMLGRGDAQFGSSSHLQYSISSSLMS